MKLLRIICREERVDAVVTALRASGAPRLFVTHVHSIGSGVDPEHYRLADGGPYTKKAKIEVVCRSEDVAGQIAAVREKASTGQRGDGVIIVSDVERVVKIRTGEEDLLALL
ncbi:MAG: P-II family nitrogen regulator [Gemmatimonadaceae bacterium]|nr:P-II family nitrogen regulator [Gemmatimonadaceae bacterium]